MRTKDDIFSSSKYDFTLPFIAHQKVPVILFYNEKTLPSPPRCHLPDSASTAQTKVQTQIVEQLEQQLYKVGIQTGQ